MTWDEVARRIGAGEPAEDVLDEYHAADREDFRTYIASQGPKGVEALARYDARMRDLDSGVMGARNAWHSISPAQKRVMLILDTRRCLIRGTSSKRYDAHGELHALANVCGIATVRNLAAHELVAWDGGTFDPERKAVLTERGKFVLEHGQKQ